MKKTEKINELAYWEKRLKDEGLDIYPDSADALNPFRSDEFQDTIKTVPTFNVITVRAMDPDVIARLDPACDPRSGGIGGYGSKGLKKIRDEAGFRYNPSSFLAKMGHEGWDFVHVVSSAGITVPRSVDNLDTAAFFTNIASARAAGEQEREATKQVLQGHVPGWFKTDTSSGSYSQ